MGGNWRGLQREGRSKLGGAQRVRLKLMSQLQPQVPYPLGHQLPALLPPGRIAAPSVGIDLLVFVRERRLKGPAMQVQFDDITGGKRRLAADA